jgi:hypothetical protein
LWLAPLILAILVGFAPEQGMAARAARSGSIRVIYVPPKSEDHRPIFDLIRKERVLEKVREILRSIRIPRSLTLKTEGCDGVSNAWYDDQAITVCYEYLDEFWKNVPETTVVGIAPIDTFVGPVVDLFLHEAGHALFDLLRVPVFGREEDAADQLSAYIMLRSGKDEARRLITGAAYQYAGDVKGETVSMPLAKFADEHGAPAQRFYNLLCIAYGADKKMFGDLVSRGYLPKERAEGCEDEYRQVAYAFSTLIGPHIDRARKRKLRRSWLPPETVKMPQYRAPKAPSR